MEHLMQNMDWDAIRVVLAVAEHRSFRQAAQDLSRSVNTLRGSVARLEDQFGFAIFHRRVDGIRLTAEGRQVVNAARVVERSMTDLMRVAQSTSDTMQGPIRLAVTEGVGTFWIIPQLVDFLAGPGRNVQVTLQCAIQAVDVLRLEADISIQTTEPTEPNIVKRRIGCVHMTLFAGRIYAEKYGIPKSITELAGHRFIEQETVQTYKYVFENHDDREMAGPNVPLRTNFASAHYWAIAKGAGIGLLPNYASAIGGDLVPLDLDFTIPVYLWLAIHPDVLKTVRHRTFLTWLDECFSVAKYPWFDEAFIKAKDVERIILNSPELQSYFAGFTPSVRPRAEVSE